MDEIWHRGAIKRQQKIGLAPKNFHADTLATLGDDVPALPREQKWTAEFWRGTRSSGLPVTTTTKENIDRVHRMVMDDEQMTINQVTNAISISCERVENILNYEVGMRKVSVRWVPRLLTPNQTHTMLITSHKILTLFETDPVGFLKSLLTQDKC
ncbi:uncharacterized protein LOC106870622 [Octopus bimaculoides]|uniref:uncharacterized protein LOC106870622 n=1 Tax=Octopus bimaculoides TaxID=37653 RepID=UPI00071E5EFD|nr:uncharacterized protein LOC106870622 [Octopus bimaculoides]|eukprot:XP_014772241.1 PREDICTED: uncharacterized protein LOC106870622 [Octopus bimaculoides]